MHWLSLGGIMPLLAGIFESVTDAPRFPIAAFFEDCAKRQAITLTNRH